jgi:hypothetical protein
VAPKLAAAVEPFGVNLVEGVMSHQMKQFVIDGNKVNTSRMLQQQQRMHASARQLFAAATAAACDSCAFRLLFPG